MGDETSGPSLSTSFEQIWVRLMRHLELDQPNMADVSKKFSACTTDLERVDFALNVLEEHDLFLEFVADGKDEPLAERRRAEGNEAFRAKNLQRAWALYTESAALADGAGLSLAYANRSAVLCELGLHAECLTDIERALRHHYPEHLHEKLARRRRRCLRGAPAPLQWHDAPPDIAEKNALIECARDCVRIAEVGRCGRGVVAARDIQIGEVLAVEAPFAVLVEKHQLSHCHECLRLCYNLVPCRRCSTTLFCGEECRSRGWADHHQYECPVLKTLLGADMDPLRLFAVRIALKSRYWGADAAPDSVYRSGRYREIHELARNADKRKPTDLFHRAVTAALAFRLFEAHTPLFADRAGWQGLFKQLVMRHSQTGPCNFHEIVEMAECGNNCFEPEKFASGAYAFLSLINHSCSPNVARYCFGTKVVLRALQTIAEGEQLFDNYGYHYVLVDKSERLTRLKEQYYFECQCEACVNNWPKYADLPVVGDIGADIDVELMKKLCLSDKKCAEENLPQLLEQLRMLEVFKPCQNHSRMQEVIKQCYSIYGNCRKLF